MHAEAQVRMQLSPIITDWTMMYSSKQPHPSHWEINTQLSVLIYRLNKQRAKKDSLWSAFLSRRFWKRRKETTIFVMYICPCVYVE